MANLKMYYYIDDYGLYRWDTLNPCEYLSEAGRDWFQYPGLEIEPELIAVTVSDIIEHGHKWWKHDYYVFVLDILI